MSKHEDMIRKYEHGDISITELQQFEDKLLMQNREDRMKIERSKSLL